MPRYQHYDYTRQALDWNKYRLIYEGGQAFIDKYLNQFSTKESTEDFNERKKTTYIPAHAKAILTDVRNAVFQRLVDITRNDCSDAYLDFVDTNVDGNGTSMLGFIGTKILPELLPLGRVGVFVDRADLGPMPTAQQLADNPPYLYIYRAEDILTVTPDERGGIKAAYLRNTIDVEKDGLVIDKAEQYKKICFNEAGFVEITTYDHNEDEATAVTQTLGIRTMPFVLFDLGESLLKDIANHQIALLNMGSSDVNFAIKANFPFYVEQYDIRTESPHLKDNDRETNTGQPTKKAGTTQGRQYPIGTERPAFINPSSECLQISMQKQQQLAAEARQLVNLTIQNLQPVRQSADSRSADDQRTIQSGMAYIGLALQRGEQQIADAFVGYEASNHEPRIIYPTDYELKTDTDRLEEAEKHFDLMDRLPSQKYQLSLARKAIRTLFGPQLSHADIDAIMDEMFKLPIINTNTLKEDLEAGIVSDATASLLRGYPAAEIEAARKSHTDRLARIAIAQSEGAAAARGVDTQGDAGSEKDLSQQTPGTTRGEGSD